MAKSSNQTLKLLHLHDILLQKNDEHGLTTAEIEIELAELKLLVDSAQASRFITEKKSMN